LHIVDIIFLIAIEGIKFVFDRGSDLDPAGKAYDCIVGLERDMPMQACRAYVVFESGFGL